MLWGDIYRPGTGGAKFKRAFFYSIRVFLKNYLENCNLIWNQIFSSTTSLSLESYSACIMVKTFNTDFIFLDILPLIYYIIQRLYTIYASRQQKGMWVQRLNCRQRSRSNQGHISMAQLDNYFGNMDSFYLVHQ